jgi:hypothetical protein
MIEDGDNAFIYDGLRYPNGKWHRDTEFVSHTEVKIAQDPPYPDVTTNQLEFFKLADEQGPTLVRVSLVLLQGDGSDDAGQYEIVCKTPSIALVLGFRRGDTTQNGHINIADAITMLNMLFCTEGRCIEPVCEIDSNNSNSVNIADVIYLLDYLFRFQAEPPVPFDSNPDLVVAPPNDGEPVFGMEKGDKPSDRIPFDCLQISPCTDIDQMEGCECFEELYELDDLLGRNYPILINEN